MITIGRIRLDFRMANEEFARALYGRWDEFCRVAVEKVVDDTLSRYDREEEVVRLESITLDLGKLAEAVFYDRFPVLLAEKLDEGFGDCLLHRERYAVEVIPARVDRVEVLLFFLCNGFLPPAVGEDYGGLSRLFATVVEESGREFVGRLREKGLPGVVLWRLAGQFSDKELEALAGVAEPSEAAFVVVYARFLLVSHRRLERPEVTAWDYRMVVWQVVLAYLLYDGRSFFSRRQMVWQTVKGLAAHFNISFGYLADLLSAGLEKFTREWVFVPELLVIFSGMRAEAAMDVPEARLAAAAAAAGEKDVSPEETEQLRRLLCQADSCRRLLAPLREEEIERLVEVVVPLEAVFVIGYARSLEREKGRGMLEGKAGSEFRLLKWEFLFSVLLDAPVSAFHRRRFVWAVLRGIAAHYNVDAVVLLSFLCVESQWLPERLAAVLRELYEAEGTEWLQELFVSEDIEIYGERERERLVYVLCRPESCRLFLRGLAEERIYRLVGIVIPSESAFVVGYARSLERERERGMLEGKAGGEFRTLKWEFIFLVVLSAPVSAFGRKQFAVAVLRQIAAHYNVEVGGLLDYFYRSTEDGGVGLPAELRIIIRELWEDARFAAAGKERKEGTEAEEERRFAEVFGVLVARGEITPQVWREVGVAFVLELLARCRRAEVAAFIRAHRERVWEVVFGTPMAVGQLERRMMRVAGMLPFLVEVYGRERVVVAFAGAGVDIGCLVECTSLLWVEMSAKGDSGRMLWWLENAPEAVVAAWRECDGERQRAVLRRMPDDVALRRAWVWRVGSVALRQVVADLGDLCRLCLSFPGERVWLAWLADCTARGCVNWSYREILAFVWQKLAVCLPVPERERVEATVVAHAARFSGWDALLRERREVAVATGGDDRQTVLSRREEVAVLEEGGRLAVGNAGLVLVAPYIPRLFSMLGYTEEGVFTGREAQIRAIFVLQWMLWEKQEFEEPELLLNKLLTGYPLREPLPREVVVDERERAAAVSLLNGVMGNWDKLRNTSLQGFRNSFLIRGGALEEGAGRWQLAVEEKAYDVLLDSLPWSFSPVKYAWMDKAIYVKWR